MESKWRLSFSTLLEIKIIHEYFKLKQKRHPLGARVNPPQRKLPMKRLKIENRSLILGTFSVNYPLWFREKGVSREQFALHGSQACFSFIYRFSTRLCKLRFRTRKSLRMDEIRHCIQLPTNVWRQSDCSSETSARKDAREMVDWNIWKAPESAQPRRGNTGRSPNRNTVIHAVPNRRKSYWLPDWRGM